MHHVLWYQIFKKKNTSAYLETKLEVFIPSVNCHFLWEMIFHEISFVFCSCSSLWRLHDVPLFFYLNALSSFLISLVSQVDLLMLLAPILQMCHLTWSSKASMRSLNHILLWLLLFFCVFFFTAKITYLSVWLPHILSVGNELKHQFQFHAEELETCWSHIVADAGIDIDYRSDVELREEPDKILPWLKSILWTLCGGGWWEGKWWLWWNYINYQWIIFTLIKRSMYWTPVLCWMVGWQLLGKNTGSGFGAQRTYLAGHKVNTWTKMNNKVRHNYKISYRL